MRYRTKKFQSPFMPLIIMMVIMMGYIFGGRKSNQNKTVPTNSQQPTSIEEDTTKKESADLTQEPEISELTEVRTNAEIALDSGVHIKDKVEDDYTMDVLKKYCSRSVVVCSSSNLQRENEKNQYRQTYDEMTGYMNLVKLSSKKQTILNVKVESSSEGITVALVFPDASYVIMDANEEIHCILPEGDSVICYIGDHISGEIMVDFDENENITGKRM